MGTEDVKSRPVLKIPSNTMTPYNAQATIFFESGFWSLYLPITVVGRVSDIWRSYFAQALFKKVGVELGFLPRPVVVQDRNPHSYLADFDAEIPLYEKSSVLVSYLLNNYVKNVTPKSTSFIEMLEKLWIDLYEREYIEKDDVQNMQLWIETLIEIGYQFPQLKTSNNLSSITLKSAVVHASSVSDIIKVRTRMNEIGHKINVQDPSTISKTKNEKCSFDKPIVFGSADLNDAPRADISSILSHLNQQFIHIVPQEMSKKYSEILQSFTQAQYLRQNVSYPLNASTNITTKVQPSWPSINSDWYKSLNVGEIDAFICTYPTAICQLWMPMNKSITFLPAHRYNLGKCTVEEWNKLDEDIKTLNLESSAKGHIIGTLSRYDVEYLKYYTGIEAELVPSYSGFYVNPDPYLLDQKRIAVISPNTTNFYRQIVNSLTTAFSFVLFNGMTIKQYTEEFGKYQAVILFPNNVMSYTITEIYALSVPIFVPSIKFYLSFHDVSNCSISDKECLKIRTFQGFKEEHFGFSMSRISSSQGYCSSNEMEEKDKLPDMNDLRSIHPYSPNIDMSVDAEAESYWLQFADFYEWPHIQYFDSYDHLKKILPNTQFESIHSVMKQELVIRQNIVLDKWCNIVQRIHGAKENDYKKKV